MRRRLAQLGGTTKWSDCALALGLVLPGARLVRGRSIAEYERAFADYIGVRHAFSFAHGRVGLYGLLRALEIGVGDEVLVPVPTHVVVANAVSYTGATPVFVDCRPHDCNIDLAAAEARITERTRALILQHTFGTPADIEAALDLGRRRGFEVLEDCVHALGARHRGRPVGSFGRAAFFSTEETKTISSTMGGVAVTDDDGIAAALRAFQAACAWPSRRLAARYVIELLGYHVLTQPHVHRWSRALYEAAGRRNPLPGPTSPAERRGRRPPGYAMRLSNAQAALALRQLRRVEENVAHRRAIAAVYARRLGPSAVAGERDQPAPLRYPLCVADRAGLMSELSGEAIAGTWFTSVLEESEEPAASGYAEGACPVAERAARRLVNLPTHPRVTAADAERLAARVAHFTLSEAPRRGSSS